MRFITIFTSSVIVQRQKIRLHFLHGATDWTRIPTSGVISESPIISKYAASAETPAVASFSEDLLKLSVKGFQIDAVAETGIEESDSEFHWSNDEHGLRCNWSLQAIAAKISAKVPKLGNQGQQIPAPFFKSRQGNYALEILFDTLIAGVNYGGDYGPEDFKELIQDPETGEEWPQNRVNFFQSAAIETLGRTLTITRSGKLELVPRSTRVGDAVFILYGCCAPVIVRKEDDGAYMWVGDAYDLSVMHGEAMAGLEKGFYHEETIVLR